MRTAFHNENTRTAKLRTFAQSQAIRSARILRIALDVESRRGWSLVSGHCWKSNCCELPNESLFQVASIVILVGMRCWHIGKSLYLLTRYNSVLVESLMLAFCTPSSIGQITYTDIIHMNPGTYENPDGYDCIGHGTGGKGHSSFGWGRRVCPGACFAERSLYIIYYIYGYTAAWLIDSGASRFLQRLADTSTGEELKPDTSMETGYTTGFTAPHRTPLIDAPPNRIPADLPIMHRPRPYAHSHKPAPEPAPEPTR
ncbi:hypothetical protein JB92DRAFT_3102415 [Gautieria morchelliformis]|nr:hypothetical protein JB92DRAFT_3102415 [Gautieria morchelliformis]